MKIGRNDPCPCGSGKKYKKCCILSNQEVRRSELVAQMAPTSSPQRQAALTVPQASQRHYEPLPLPPRSPEREASDARWGAFKEATDEGRRVTFLETLADPELMCDEVAFEMLDTIFLDSVASGERDAYDDLVEQLRERLPDVYATDRKYYLQHGIQNAIVSGRSDRVLALSLEMAETAGEDVEMYSEVVDLLAYHGLLAVLSEASRIAWPLIKDAEDIMCGQYEFADWGMDCALFEHLERTREIDGRDPELIEQSRFYQDDLELDGFARYVTQISGQNRKTWSLSDLQTPSQKGAAGTKKAAKNGEQTPPPSGLDTNALSELLHDFVDYARHEEGVPYTKVRLVRNHIHCYLFDRENGELEPKRSMLEAMMNPQPKVQVKPSIPDHPLCPDHMTLECFLSGLLGFMSRQLCACAATFELMPAWLRFLEARGLIERAQREKTLAEIGSLQPKLMVLWEQSQSVPMLAENLKRWGETVDVLALKPDAA